MPRRQQIEAGDARLRHRRTLDVAGPPLLGGALLERTELELEPVGRDLVAAPDRFTEGATSVRTRGEGGQHRVLGSLALAPGLRVVVESLALGGRGHPISRSPDRWRGRRGEMPAEAVPSRE